CQRSDRGISRTTCRSALVSRDWSGKTTRQHRVDRAQIVRATLTEAGIDPDQHGIPDGTTDDGAPRYTWSAVDPLHDDLPHHRVIIAQLIIQRMRWRQQYEAAKTRERPCPTNLSATGRSLADGPEHFASASPDN